MSTPERIWAWPWEITPNMGQWWADREIVGEGREYIRADTVAEMIRQAVQAEREACAKVCEGWKEWNSYTTDIAAAIRARGEG